MTNKIIFKLEIDKDNLNIVVNEKIAKKISIKNKNINTNDIYNILKYDKNNEYVLDSKKFDDDEIVGKEQEMRRLYNYTYDLFFEIIDAVNEENKKILKEQKSK